MFAYNNTTILDICIYSYMFCLLCNISNHRIVCCRSLCVGTRSGYSLLSTKDDQVLETYAISKFAASFLILLSLHRVWSHVPRESTFHQQLGDPSLAEWPSEVTDIPLQTRFLDMRLSIQHHNLECQNESTCKLLLLFPFSRFTF